MGLRDILKKKDKIEDSTDDNKREDANASHENVNFLSASDAQYAGEGGGASRPRRISDAFKPRSRGSSTSSRPSSMPAPDKGGPSRRISQRLHLKRAPASSENVPENLPEIVVAGGEDEAEKQWEKRATILAKTANENELHRGRPASPTTDPYVAAGIQGGLGSMRISNDQRQSNTVASSPAIDADIQEAIRLHEEGELKESTRLFGILADPNGANNSLSQVLYGLALRHGWGCEPIPEKAVFYLSAAAKNAADVESLALQAGLKKGGAAKGELVLAIFELANCFRQGWGIEKDPIAAKQVCRFLVQLAMGDAVLGVARLGLNAMNEIAWCYLEGFGCKKDKYSAAKYYRLAEKNGNKTLGNSWIWKDKYNPENRKTGKK
ncbi:putative cell cycle inhibitor nif1 [Diaporthe ampelina]|uniref:Putative cell cycle inhibitor nif1 n=1 Tax=Diaporthe ampelina TaxID=1214573 RepID=A0A0G2FS95_9PEZI|nr:putative cell cycle inhibitor nif1 [Diaporthe ampelina]